jgi:hypothetical protein
MLAYVSWHSPAVPERAPQYEERLAAFHRALQTVKPDGFLRSMAYRVHDGTWLPGAPGYEDWYEVVDWAALGVLNATAVSASVRSDHDAVAELAGGGGGLYGLLRPASTDPASHTLATWAVKPRQVSYPDFIALLEMFPVDCALWQRQMVLGPAPEFCIAGPEALIRELGVPPQWQPQLVHRVPIF